MSKGVVMVLLLVATHMKIVMVVPAIGQPVNHSRIAVEGKDNRLIARGERAPVLHLTRHPRRRTTIRLHVAPRRYPRATGPLAAAGGTAGGSPAQPQSWTSALRR